MRVRITFSKQGALRYSGHLDLYKLWERAARRADLPLSYSQGFHPQPKIHMAAALPLGFSSRGEVMDLILNEERGTQDIVDRLQASLPEGIRVLGIEVIDDRAPALQTQTLSAAYDVHFSEPVEASGLTAKIQELMKRETLPRERRGKSYDLRPLIEMLSVVTEANGNVWLRMTLAAREGATGRPDEVLAELGFDASSARIERTRLIFV